MSRCAFCRVSNCVIVIVRQIVLRSDDVSFVPVIFREIISRNNSVNDMRGGY